MEMSTDDLVITVCDSRSEGCCEKQGQEQKKTRRHCGVCCIETDGQSTR